MTTTRATRTLFGDEILLEVRVPVEAALRRGQTTCGTVYVRPTEEELATLSEDERAGLVAYVPRRDVSAQNGLRALESIASPTVAWDDVATAYRAARAERVDVEARARREAEERVLSALAAPVDDWVDGSFGVAAQPTGIYLSDEQRRDPRVVALRESPAVVARAARRREERVLALLARPVEEDLVDDAPSGHLVRPSQYGTWDVPGIELDPRYRARLAEVQAEGARRAAEKARRKEEFAVLARAYVVDRVPEFARAALDGRDVSGQAKKAVLEEVLSWLSAFEVVKTYQYKSQPTPRSLAYDRLDAVLLAITARVGLLVAPNHPLIRSVELEIGRGDVAPNGEDDDWRTVVTVDVTLVDGTELDQVAACAEESCVRRRLDDGDDDGEEE